MDNKELDKICYKKNYVQKVICKFDFASSIETFKKSMPKKIYDVIKKYFPVAEPKDVIGTELQINVVNIDSTPAVDRILMKQWFFLTRNRKGKCIVNHESVTFIYNEYDCFETIENGIIEVLKAILIEFNDIQGKRIGLRYINNLPMKGHNDWINEDFFNAIKAHRNESITRLLTSLEYAIVEKDINVRFSYGYFNPDYPSIIKREEFLIDVDAYSQGIIYQEDVSNFLSNMHYENQKCFEKMITDSFRKELNKIE